MSKYHNVKVRTLDGVIHDSRREATRWNQLRLLEKGGYITNIRRQVRFVLIPAQYEASTVGRRGGIKRGKLLERECAYVADFVYTDLKTNEIVVEDTKGYRTKDYIIKRKLMLQVHNIKVKEV